MYLLFSLWLEYVRKIIFNLQVLFFPSYILLKMSFNVLWSGSMDCTLCILYNFLSFSLGLNVWSVLMNLLLVVLEKVFVDYRVWWISANWTFYNYCLHLCSQFCCHATYIFLKSLLYKIVQEKPQGLWKKNGVRVYSAQKLH